MVSFNSRSDIGSILTKAAPPPETPSSNSILDAMRLNITVRIGATTVFRTGFAERLEASADLTVRGTVSHPGMLGRVVISEGELVFFGTKYSLSDGAISFYNPNRIDPILALNLTTTARGVRVDLSVTGPVANMSLSYRSDPPLQFSEIISLLAAGRAPTSDPVLVANQPQTPQQTLPQMGASALLGAAIANPVAGQLQRVFGVTQLKIDPTFTSGSELPQARLTVQQQISSDLTFTYVTNVTRSDPQIIRVEWAIDDNWSALATRQENGMIGVDLFYKRRFQ
jgi:translocation and assembly module TamB